MRCQRACASDPRGRRRRAKIRSAHPLEQVPEQDRACRVRHQVHLEPLAPALQLLRQRREIHRQQVHRPARRLRGLGVLPHLRPETLREDVREARDAGVRTVQDAVTAGRAIAGWEVDRAVRNHIKNAGFGDYFIHRTGHSINTEVHANGANMDDLEIHDERRILPNSCFSIEPGIYLPEFGVRSEVNVLVRPQSAEVTGKIQTEIVLI